MEPGLASVRSMLPPVGYDGITVDIAPSAGATPMQPIIGGDRAGHRVGEMDDAVDDGDPADEELAPPSAAVSAPAPGM